MLASIFAFILGSFGIGAVGIFFATDSHYPFIQDLNFDYYDYEIAIEFPGIWFPYKEAACTDLFLDSWAAEDWPCAESFTVTYTIFKTQNYYAWLEHFAQRYEQKMLERETRTFNWPQNKTEVKWLQGMGYDQYVYPEYVPCSDSSDDDC